MWVYGIWVCECVSVCVLLLLCCCCCLCNFQARPLNHAQSCILAPLAQKEVQVASPTDEWGDTHKHTHAHTTHIHTRTLSCTHTLLSGMHSFRSTTIVDGRRDRRRTFLQQVGSSVARRFLSVSPFPLSACFPCLARFLFPDLHFNWFLSSVLKSLANVFGEHVFYANI